MNDQIAAVEAASYAAWPARELSGQGGWQLRYADGFSRRGNSVLPLGPLPQDLTERIDRCKRWYGDRGSDLVFRLTPLCDPAMESALCEQGFTLEGETRVMTSDLSTDADPGSSLPEIPTSRWWGAMAGMWQIDASRRPAWRGVIDRIEQPAAYPLLTDGNVNCAAGLGVVAGDWLGLFEIIVAESERRQGRGLELTGALLRWGQSKGARHAFLQVVVGNEPAVALYERLGFRELYRYWYRRAPR